MVSGQKNEEKENWVVEMNLELSGYKEFEFIPRID
jgi:hypothetical protein